ncbi:MAG: hypothetical protein LCI00_13280 [Chloroflexi bacterium]|nr:hypothetical protein [Chloroflexota bacterium]
MCLQRLQRMTQGTPPILPFRPQIFPDPICDFTNGVQPQRPRLFFINILQFSFEVGTLVGTHPP